MNIKPAQAADIPRLAELAETTGLFPADYLADMIAPYLTGDETQLWHVAETQGQITSFCFTRAEEMAEGAWNMLALGVDPTFHRQGQGGRLVAALEDQLRSKKQRVLVVDTSSDPAQVPACAFYAAMGYTQVGRIPEFWGPGEDKITFSKTL